MKAPPDLETFRALLDEHGVNEDTLVLESDGTVFSPAATRPVHSATLPTLAGSAGAEIDLVGTLGKGGMGTIHLANQTSLEREVAVKQAIGESEDRHEAASALLTEARVMGKLEHPNIVPVHALGVNASGEVLLVMKRIEGTVWSTLLAERETVLDGLERHIEILMEVCNAIEFAHGRGIVHRDLKPTNVMVGSFGEIYVLDWGLAVGVPGRAPRGVPMSDELTGVVGTPAYMAPEMAVPDGHIDPRTDVYLLGAVLHKIVTGLAPHSGKAVMEGLHEAFISRPKTYGPEVPVELAQICARAMSREPEARFASVREFRDALDAYRRHASARELCAEAGQRLTTLSRDDASDDDRQRAFTEARFGFEQALRIWPESPVAVAGLEATLTAMGRHELDAGRVESAELILKDMRAPPPVLAERLEALRGLRATEADDLAAFRREQDSRIGQRARAVIILGIGVGWFTVQLITGALVRSGDLVVTQASFLIAQVAMLVFVGMAVVALRARLFINAKSRSLMGSLMGSLVGLVFLWLVTWQQGIAVSTTLGISHTLMLVATIAGAATDKRLWPATFVLPLGCLAAAVPVWALEINGAVVFAALAITAISLRGDEPEWIG